MESEHYRAIRSTVERMHQERGTSVIGVSSPSAQDGKTVTTLNLAGCLAQDKNTRVMVIDADLRKPTVPHNLRMKSPGPGLTGALVRADCTLEQVVRLHSRYNLAVLPAGVITGVPYELLNSPRMSVLLQESRRLFDYVFIDLPPLPFPECRVIEKYVDGLIIVVAAHRTARTPLKESLDSMDSSKIIGLVFNEDTQRKSRIPSYYYKRTSAPEE